MEWFAAGGFIMFVLLGVGAGAIGFGVQVARKPTAAGLAMLQAMPALLGAIALAGVGLCMWAVHQHVPPETLIQSPGIALAGFMEAAQPLTLGGLLMMVLVLLRMVAEANKARAMARGPAGNPVEALRESTRRTKDA